MKILVAVIGFVLGAAAFAHAGASGIFAEQSTAVDGVVVRRIRDESNGVVCYVASGRAGWSDGIGQATYPAISCLKVPSE